MTQIDTQSDLHDASPSGRVMRWITESIETNRLVPGAPLPAERQLADRLHVSRTAVRAALDRLVANGLVIQPSDGRRRRVAPSAGAGRVHRAVHAMLSDTIALLSTNRPASDADPPTVQIRASLAAVQQQIESSGYHSLLVHPARLQDRGVEALSAAGIKGLLVVDEADTSPQVREVLKACREQIRVVVRGYGPESRRYDRVMAGHEQGTYELTRWMLARGRRRILRFWRVTGAPPWLGLRDAGYQRAMREAGLEPLPAVRLPEIPPHQDAESALHDYARLYAGYLMEHVRGPEPIDAALVATDAHAYQLAASLRFLGLKPNEDVLLAGFDNLVEHLPWRQWEPAGPLVTVDKNNEESGRMMVDLLMQRLAGELPDEPQCRRAPPRLVEVTPADRRAEAE